MLRRKPRVLVLAALALIPVLPAWAQNSAALSPDFCQALVKHVPDADVTYQPGVDVHGKAVAPADLPGGNTFQVHPVAIPLTADLAQIIGLNANKFPFNTMGRTDISLGTLTVEDERVLYNGAPLTDAQQDNLAVLCLKPRGANK